VYNRGSNHAATILGPNPYHVLNQGAKGWWLTAPGYSGGLEWWDLFGRNRGTLTGASSRAWFGSSRRWGACQFDGTNSYVALPATAGVATLKVFTWSCWINTTSTVVGRVFLGESRISDTKPLFYVAQNGTTAATVEIFFRDDFNSAADLVGAITINDGRWHNVLVLCDGTTFALFVDGLLDGSTLGPPSTLTIDQTSLGTLSYGGNPLAGFQWAGQIDDVRSWTRCFTGNEVRDLYYESLAGHPETLLYLHPSTMTYLIPPAVSPGTPRRFYPPFSQIDPVILFTD
jgi:hypothetical protein